MLLSHTDPERSKAHRGLSMFVIPKERGEGHGLVLDQVAGADGGAPGGGRLEGRTIDTIGHRGMYYNETASDAWIVADANLVGGEEGLGRGFDLKIAGFVNGSHQTAASERRSAHV